MSSHDYFGQVQCPTKFCSNMLLPNEIFASLGETNYDKFALSVVRLRERQELSEIRELQKRFNDDGHESVIRRSAAKSKDNQFLRKDLENSANMKNAKGYVATKQPFPEVEFSSTLESEKPPPQLFSNGKNCADKTTTNQQAGCSQQNTEEFEKKQRCQEDDETQRYIQNMMASKEAMQCPKCGILVMKDDGCSFVTCAACELEICFLTQKPRHGVVLLDGQFIDGCHCMENGVRCHPQCTNCH